MYTYVRHAALHRRPLYAMVAWMSLCDWFFSLKFLVPALLGRLDVDDSDWLCKTEAFVESFFGLASVSWYFMIAVNTFKRPFP